MPLRRLAAILIVVLAVTPARAAINHDQIEDSLKRAREALLHAQNRDGNWEDSPAPKQVTFQNGDRTDGGQWGGATALATYALLAAGENPQSPPMKAAIAFLEKCNTPGIYAVGLRAQVWNTIPMTEPVRRALQRDGEILRKSMKSGGDARGLFYYTGDPSPEYDHSVSQFGILGMWACVQAGYQCPGSFWSEADAAWRKHQGAEGGWEYIGVGERPTASMTAAGVATLFITQDYVRQNFDRTGNAEDKHIEAGLKWMGNHVHQAIQEQSSWPGYTLFGIERIGVAAGRKYLGNVNWFEAGAEYLLANQKRNGTWGANNGGNRDEVDVPATGFCMLFLARGRAPVIMNKLAYDQPPAAKAKPDAKPTPGNWDLRPRDIANVARWIGRQTERDLNWQVVDLHGPVDELHDAPILYISGNQALNFADDDKAKLRQYVEEGGIILGNADGGSPAFAASFVKLGQALFPGRTFADLPPDHVIFTREQFARDQWKAKPNVQHLTNGTRELMILLPTGDPSRAWQAQTFAVNKEPFELAADLFLYAVDKGNLRWRGERVIVRPNPAKAPSINVHLARLQHAGNWDPEPGGWRRIAAILHNQFDIELTIDAITLGDGKLTFPAVSVAHLTGTGALDLSSAAKSELKRFIDAGGTLITDAAAGSTEFAASVDAALQGMYPEPFKAAAFPLPPSHPVYQATGTPTDINYRPYARRLVGNTHNPRIRGLELNHRLAAFISAEDLTTGLVGQAVDGINGYTPASATDIMLDLILYSTGNAKRAGATTMATTAPATRP